MQNALQLYRTELTDVSNALASKQTTAGQWFSQHK